MRRCRDLPLGKEPSSRLIPWIVGFMVYLGCLLAGATFYITGQAHHWKSQLGSSLTIEIPLSDELSQPAAQEQVFSIVNKLKGVTSAQVLPQEEVQNLLQSWVPENLELSSLPIPLIVDVVLNPNAKIDVVHLENMLKTISADANVVDHRPWVQEVKNVILIVTIISSLILALLLLATTFITVFATRTSLLIHRQIIEVLHLIGATSTYIARQFDTHTLKQGLVAGVTGSLLAALTFGGIYFSLQELHLEVVFDHLFLQNTAITLLVTPFLIATLMLITARRTVKKTLANGAY